MRLVAVIRPPERPDEAANVQASALRLAPAEARLRLAPEPPAIVARLDPHTMREARSRTPCIFTVTVCSGMLSLRAIA